jgi:hypothetical protein
MVKDLQLERFLPSDKHSLAPSELTRFGKWRNLPAKVEVLRGFFLYALTYNIATS